MQTAVSNLINHHHDQPSWWYGIHYNAKSPHSLCSFLGIDPDDYQSFLRSMNLLDSRMRINREKTEKLASTMVGTNWQWFKTDGKKQIFICIGKLPAKNKKYPTTAEGQFDMYSKKKIFPPKRSSDISSKQTFSEIWKQHQTIQDNENNIIHKKSSTAVKKTNILPSVVTPSTKATVDIETQLDREKILNILGRELLSKLIDEEALKNVVGIFKASLTVEEVLDCVANTHVQVREERDNILQKKKNALIHATQPQQLNILPSRFPFMLSKDIDVQNSDVISRLLREVSTLQKEVVSKGGPDIFNFLQGNDRSTTLIRVPTNKTRSHFQHNLTPSNNKGYNFVFRMLDAMVPPQKTNDVIVEEEEDDDDDDDADHDRSTVLWTKRNHAAEGMLVYLGKRFGAAFIKAADTIAMPVVRLAKKRMDPIVSAAMCDDAGLSNTQKKIINQYATYHFGHPLTASERDIRALGANAIPPIAGECEVNEEHCSFWKKDPVEVFQTKIAESVTDSAALDWNKLDIIMGGDHGQGAFCLPVKLLLKMNEKVKIKFEVNLGEVECKKDTSEILRASFLPYLNERLKKIVKYERDASNKIKNDGYIYEIECLDSTHRFSFNDDTKEGEFVLQKRPLRFMVTGDLAFYAVILGMKNASPFHCHLCLLRKTDWEKRPLAKGEPRTMQWIQNNWHKARQGKGGRVCGVIEQPLLDAIDPSRFVVPPLHSMLGVANSILNDFKVFIDLLLEDSPPHLKALRNSELKAEKVLLDKGEEIREWGTLNGPALASCHEEKEELTTLLHSMLVAGEGTDEEKRAINEEIDSLNERLASLHEEREKLVGEESLLSTAWRKKKAKLSAFLKTKNNKKYIKPVKARFEACLRQFGIDYAAYHGGDLVGNDCRKLMGRAEEIMGQVEGVLLAIAGEKRKKSNTKDAISSRCRAIRDALVVFDSVFAIVNKPNADVEMEKDLPQLKVLLEKGLLAWTNLKDENERGDKNITPKVHGLVQHLPEQFEMYGGIGDFDEQFVERHHQTGKRDRYRSRNMRNRNVKYSCHSFWEQIRKNREVISTSEKVKESRKRNFKGERKETAKEEASNMRATIRHRIIGNIVPKDLSAESSRILAMKELTEYNPVEDEIDYDRVDDGGGGGGTMEASDDDGDGIDVVDAENI